MEYLFNVVLGLTPYIVVAATIFIVSYFVCPKIVRFGILDPSEQLHNMMTDTIRLIRRFGYLFIFIVMMFGVYNTVFTPINTYKHQTHDRNAALAGIEENRRKTNAVVIDVSRQPNMTPEERQKRFDENVDYKKLD